MPSPAILFLDIETAPIVAYVWQLFDQNVALNQIKGDWHLLSFSAKWAHEPKSKIIYHDQRNEKKIEDDFKLLEKVWDLLDKADIVIGQNSMKFDIKKLNSRFILNDMKPPSSYRQIDTLVLAKKHFSFTSNKLEYTSSKLCPKNAKLKHTKFPGFELWKECLNGNIKAWKEMERYNKQDVLALEEYYNKLKPWNNSINFDVYHKNHSNVCSCGSKDLMKYGFRFTNTGKFQRFICRDCGHETNSKLNEFSVKKKKSLTR